MALDPRRRACVTELGSQRYGAGRGSLHSPHPPRRQAERVAGDTSHRVRARPQSEDRQGARPHLSSAAARPCRRGHRMSNCVGSSRYGLPAARGRCREPTPVTPHYAAFPTYKAAGVRHRRPMNFVEKTRKQGDRVRRREIVGLLGGLAAAWPLTVRAQPSRKRVVAVLMPYPDNDAEVRARLAAARDEMRKLGWSEGENLRVEERWAGDNLARIEADAAELIRLEPDVIFVTGGRVVPIVQKQTRTIPVVFVGVSDPLGRGLVTSLARPQGNLTGIALSEYSVVTKQVEILKEIAPSVTRAGLMFNPDNPSAAFHRAQFEAAAAALERDPS